MDHSAGFLKLVNEVKPNINECTMKHYVQHITQVEHVLIDVREESEWRLGHLPNAVHIGKGVLERDVENKIPNLITPLYLYCGGGFRSALAADALQRMGYRNVTSIDGGFSAWSEMASKLKQGMSC